MLYRAFKGAISSTVINPPGVYNCKRNVELLEQGQRRPHFTKRLQGLRYHAYEKRLRLLNLQKLVTHRTGCNMS